MLAEVIIVLLLVGILVLLLRHWPETETVVRQQVNVRKPKEEREGLARPKRAWWQGVVSWFARTSEGVMAKFQPKKPIEPMSFDDPIKPESIKKKILLDDDLDEPAKPEPTEETVEILMAKAETAQKSGNYVQAEDCLVRAAAKDPRNAKIYSRLGIVYLEQGENWAEAEEAFSTALKYDPNNGYVHNNLGLVLYNRDKFAAAAREFEQALSADDQIASRHVNLGLAYMSLRQFQKAESAFKRASKLDPNNREYHDLLEEASEKRKSHRSN